jgi:hypothetical protein
VIQLRAENIQNVFVKGIRTIALSPLVQIYDAKRGVWITCLHESTNVGAYETDTKRSDIFIELKLPEQFNNGN